MHDWQGLADLFAPDLRFDDRRPLLRMTLPKEGFLEQFRVLFDVPNEDLEAARARFAELHAKTPPGSAR